MYNFKNSQLVPQPQQNLSLRQIAQLGRAAREGKMQAAAAAQSGAPTSVLVTRRMVDKGRTPNIYDPADRPETVAGGSTMPDFTKIDTMLVPNRPIVIYRGDARVENGDQSIVHPLSMAQVSRCVNQYPEYLRQTVTPAVWLNVNPTKADQEYFVLGWQVRLSQPDDDAIDDSIEIQITGSTYFKGVAPVDVDLNSSWTIRTADEVVDLIVLYGLNYNGNFWLAPAANGGRSNLGAPIQAVSLMVTPSNTATKITAQPLVGVNLDPNSLGLRLV